jgi:predicted AAA+ superfamily ATPase
MYARRLQLPDRSFFLFGPRGTGKTTWLRQVLPGVYTGAAELKDGPLRVLPWKAFLKELAAGNILG